MRELHSEVIGDRWMRLLVDQTGRYNVTIQVRGPNDIWQGISLRSDSDLGLPEASLCYRLRCTEQEARAIAWGE